MTNNKNLNILLKKVEEEAYNSGLNYFIALASNNEKPKVISNNIQNNSVIKDLQKFWEGQTKKFGKVLFRDLYDYIQIAEKDYYGQHFPFNKDKSYSFHIYNGRFQVNICKYNKESDSYDSMVNFIFNPKNEEVKIVKVNQYLVADYDNPLVMGWYTPVNDSLWVSFIGGNSAIREIIRDALGPFLNK